MSGGVQRRSLYVSFVMMLAIAMAWVLTPRELMFPAPPPLAEVIPAKFGDWREVNSALTQVSPYYQSEVGEPDVDNPYTDILARSYVNSKGVVVQLMLAYANRLTQEVKIHRPELCYQAQGFQINQHDAIALPMTVGSAKAITGHRMLVNTTGRKDAVTYWIRVGNSFSTGAGITRYNIFFSGLQGVVPDGILVRVSQAFTDERRVSSDSYQLQERFLADLLASAPQHARHLLIGGMQ